MLDASLKIIIDLQVHKVIEVESCKTNDIVVKIQNKYHTFSMKGVQKGKHVPIHDCHCVGAT